MKVLWVSNAAFCGTGYGVATKSVTQQLLRHGHEPLVLAYWGLQGSTQMEVEGVVHFSPRVDTWGNDYMEELARRTGVDFILVHRDIWVNSAQVEERTPLAAWFPVDHAPLGAEIADHIKRTRWPATMSQHGQRMCWEAGFDVAYLPHSFNPETFYYNRSLEGRKAMNIPEDAFLVTIVAANKGFPSRKGFPEMFQALAQLQKRHPDVWVYCHTLPTSEQGGPDLNKVATFYGMALERTAFLDPFMFWYGIEAEQLASFYQASDVLLNTSYGEGFGIPVLEAQACGTPVITTNFSSLPEITFNGWTVGGTKTLTPMYTDWMVPDVGQIVDALEDAYDSKGSLRKAAVGQAVAARLARDWTDEAVFEQYWKPWLAKVEGDISLLRGGSI